MSATSRIFKITPLAAEILHIVWWSILFWATLYKWCMMASVTC